MHIQSLNLSKNFTTVDDNVLIILSKSEYLSNLEVLNLGKINIYY
jgi:hypothetical protein